MIDYKIDNKGFGIPEIICDGMYDLSKEYQKIGRAHV